MNFPNWKTSDIIIPDLINKGFRWTAALDFAPAYLGRISITFLEFWVFCAVPAEDRVKFINLCNEFGVKLWTLLDIDSIFALYQGSVADDTMLKGIEYELSQRMQEYECNSMINIKEELIKFLLGLPESYVNITIDI